MHPTLANQKLVGNLTGFYYRRISIQHRLVYSVLDEQKTVHVLRMWTQKLIFFYKRKI
jgi:Txe/YoeB family toxin of Txe-Axe toxin-antitoxin module